jgi:GTP cyclohydrolase II
MNVTLGPQITLETTHGDFAVQHVYVHGNDGVFREGVVLQRESGANGEILIRIQSSCLFSESFWTTDCDCALQLHEALARIAKRGGTLLYFYEEGRGAGLEAKFKAIELQQVQGLDTKQAYECLKMNVDNRSYEAAAKVIQDLYPGKAVTLLTNNPAKVEGLVAGGVTVAEREALLCGLDKSAIRRYLREKAVLLGHIIPSEGQLEA